MRNLLYISLFLLLLPSCEAPEIKAVTSREQPYVRLKSGTVIHSHDIKWSYGKFNKELNVNGHAYTKSEIATFSNGYNTFATARGNKITSLISGKYKFAALISEGNVDVFKVQQKHLLNPNKKSKYGNYGGPYIVTYSRFGPYYIQNNQHNVYRALEKLTYKNLEPMIPGSAQAYTLLKQYKHQRNFTNISTGLGIGLIAGGLILMNSHGIKKGNPQGLGMATAVGGLAVTGISLSIALPRPYKLYKIARLYNSVRLPEVR